MKELITEKHAIKPFGKTNLGIIRLEKLANTSTISVKIDDKEFEPIGYDTYGHPIISAENYQYYKAKKAIAERRGDSLLAEVTYDNVAFCLRKEVFDSAEAIETAVKQDKACDRILCLKNVLNYRKKENFIGEEMQTFILFKKYVLASNGHIYKIESLKEKDKAETEKDAKTYEYVLTEDEVENYSMSEEEVHIPGEDDKCAVCGKKFLIGDVENDCIGLTDDFLKVHKDCLEESKEANDYYLASQIIDAVYTGTPESKVIKEYDPDENKTKIWYKYHTVQGDIRIRIKRKVIVIEWLGNFKPFNISLFDNERVTKYDTDDMRGIHAWSREDAIKYLNMAKKA